MIDQSFIEKIESMVKADKVITVDGRNYSVSQLVPVKAPKAESFTVNTLTGLVDYLGTNPDKLNYPAVIVHIAGPQTVSVFSPINDDFKKRDHYIQATAQKSQFPFGQYYAVENFIIAIQTHFVPSEITGAILKIVGNLTDGKTTNYNDDGVTQQVTAKAGITRVENVPVPNPVKLAPYRTFLEVTQPESSYILRIQSKNEAPTCALFETGGGQWELEAIGNIRGWLKEKLPRDVVILA